MQAEFASQWGCLLFILNWKLPAFSERVSMLFDAFKTPRPCSWYTYLEPKWPLFWRFWSITFRLNPRGFICQHRGHQGSSGCRYLYLYVYVIICTCMYTYVYMYNYVVYNICIYIYIYPYTYIYTHSHIHIFWDDPQSLTLGLASPGGPKLPMPHAAAVHATRGAKRSWRSFSHRKQLRKTWWVKPKNVDLMGFKWDLSWFNQ